MQDLDLALADLTAFRVLDYSIGSKANITGWPSNDLAGLIQALQQWTLDPWMNFAGSDATHPHVRFEAPFRTLAWCSCVVEPIPGAVHRKRFVGTRPIHAEHPVAVRFSGNFLDYSFGFSIDTDDQKLIQLLDDLIAKNMASPYYVQAASQMKRRRA